MKVQMYGYDRNESERARRVLVLVRDGKRDVFDELIGDAAMWARLRGLLGLQP
jgi:hypothetical protein